MRLNLAASNNNITEATTILKNIRWLNVVKLYVSVYVTAHKYQTNQCDQVQHRSSALQSFKEITSMLFRYEARSQAGVPGCSKY